MLQEQDVAFLGGGCHVGWQRLFWLAWWRQVTHAYDLVGATTIPCWRRLVVVVHDMAGLSLGIGAVE
jgi:hypothetical protein